MLLDALLLNQLLSGDVAGSKENSRGHGLREQRPLEQLGLVPDGLACQQCSWNFTKVVSCVRRGLSSPSQHLVSEAAVSR